MREFINRFGYVVVGVCVVIALSVWFFTRGGGRTGNPLNAYYIDDETGEESVQSQAAVPPLIGKAGKPTLVKVMKVSNEGGRNPYVAYYIRYTPEAQAKINEILAAKDPNRDEEENMWRSKGEQVRLPAPGSPWVASLSDDGSKVKESVIKNNQPTIAVFPP